MNRLLGAVVFFLSASSFAAQWDTPFCRQIFGKSEGQSEAIYTSDIRIVEKHTMDTSSELTAERTDQILEFAFHNMEKESFDDAIESFDNEEITYLTIIYLPTGKRYNHLKGFRGDTEISVIFEDDDARPIAFTGDGDCYQE